MTDHRETYRIGGDRWPASGVGGKAAGLHRAARSDWPVPRGFCVMADAFRAAVRRHVVDVDTLDELRRCLRRRPLPESTRGEIRDRLDAIGARRWAVRSSAVEEDSEAQSFAGQFRTELGVAGPESVFEAVRRVWADLYDLDALVYRHRVRVDAVPAPMAVIVQEMVDVEVGGVMFTRDPAVAGGEAPISISVAEGEVEEVVSGRGGRHLTVDRASGEILAVDGENRGADDVPLEAAGIETLASWSRGLEDEFGSDLDVEWAWGHDSTSEGAGEPRPYLLQVRPASDSGDDGPVVWSNANVGEALPGVGTPLTWSIIGNFSRRGFERAFGALGLDVPEEYELVGSFRGRVYLNVTEFVSIADAIPFVDPSILHEMAGGSGLDLVEQSLELDPGLRRSFLRRLPTTVARIAASQLSMPLVAPLWEWYFDRSAARLERETWSGADRETLGEVLGEIDWLFDRNGLVALTCGSNFVMSYLVMRTAVDWFGSSDLGDRVQELIGALDVSSARPGLDLLRLGDRARRIESVRELLVDHEPDRAIEELRARRDEPEVAAFLDDLRRFQREHGFRAPREAELSTPRWRENPEFLLGVLRNYVAVDEQPTADEYERDRDRRRREFDRAIDREFGRAGGALFRLIFGWARMTARLREDLRSRVVRSLDLYRRFALTVGERLARVGVIPEPDDVFYLRYDEIAEWVDGRNRPEEYRLRSIVRRAVTDRLQELPDPPNTFLLREGEIVAPEMAEATDRTRAPDERDVRRVLEGLSANRGIVTGPARVVEDPEGDESIEPGEILVAPYADIGWTPLFLSASGLVVGLGGPLSHGSIVAREYGLPTVVNASGATDVVETGDVVTVDGDAGRVYVHD
ncbi:MAG: PEP/pyruvate-binding domain-containing protein [Bradymonadaceae bacterium]